MDGILDIELGESRKSGQQSNNTVILSLLDTVGGIAGITEILQQDKFEALLESLQLDDNLSDVDLLSRILGVEPLISEQEHGNKP